MISLSNGEELRFVSASGALGYDGRGWPWEWPFRWTGLLDPSRFANITKTLTLSPRKGNFRWYRSCVKILKNKSVVNAFGLSNPGIDWWLQKVDPKLNPKYKIILSIAPFTLKEASILADKTNQAQNIIAVEVNVSCPNTTRLCTQTETSLRMLRTFKKKCRYPLIAKIGYTYPDKLIPELGSLVEAIDAINTVPWNIVFPDKKSPFERFGGGGVSGRAIQKYGQRKVRKIIKLTSTPVIGGAGIFNLKDADQMKKAGAKALSLGVAFLFNCATPNKIARQMKI